MAVQITYIRGIYVRAEVPQTGAPCVDASRLQSYLVKFIHRSPGGGGQSRCLLLRYCHQLASGPRNENLRLPDRGILHGFKTDAAQFRKNKIVEGARIYQVIGALTQMRKHDYSPP